MALICRKEVQEDKGARKSMENGFVIDEKFRDYSVDDLCTTGFRVALRVKRNKKRQYLS